jgi:hypothetical protein
LASFARFNQQLFWCCWLSFGKLVEPHAAKASLKHGEVCTLICCCSCCVCFVLVFGLTGSVRNRRSFVIDPLDVELADLIINKVPELQAKVRWSHFEHPCAKLTGLQAAERIAPLENAMARKSILHKQHMQCAALEKETQKGRSASLSPPEQFGVLQLFFASGLDATYRKVPNRS